MGQAVERWGQLRVDHIQAGALAADVDHAAALEEAGIGILIRGILLGEIAAELPARLGVGSRFQRVKIQVRVGVQGGFCRMWAGKLRGGVNPGFRAEAEVIEIDGLCRDEAKVGRPPGHTGAAARHRALRTGRELHRDHGAGGKDGRERQKQPITPFALPTTQPPGPPTQEIKGRDRQEVENDQRQTAQDGMEHDGIEAVDRLAAHRDHGGGHQVGKNPEIDGLNAEMQADYGKQDRGEDSVDAGAVGELRHQRQQGGDSQGKADRKQKLRVERKGKQVQGKLADQQNDRKKREAQGGPARRARKKTGSSDGRIFCPFQSFPFLSAGPSAWGSAGLFLSYISIFYHKPTACQAESYTGERSRAYAGDRSRSGRSMKIPRFPSSLLWKTVL